MTRVFVVDDHDLFRAGVKAELANRVEIVGDASTVDTAIAQILKLQPDVVVLDVHMRDGGGREVIRQVSSQNSSVKFLGLSVSDEPRDVVDLIRAGARGYATKNVSPDDLAAAIECVAGGDAWFSPSLAGIVLDVFSGLTQLPVDDEELQLLTRRERDVLRLIARGYTYREAAADLVISPKTFEHHVSAILRKLQLVNRHQLALWATERKLV